MLSMARNPTSRHERSPAILVLSRKLGEKVHIGEGPGRAVVTVVDIDRGKIRLGIEAARDVPIYRAELLPAHVQDEARPVAKALTPDEEEAEAQSRVQRAAQAYQEAHKAWQAAIRKAEAARKEAEARP